MKKHILLLLALVMALVLAIGLTTSAGATQVVKPTIQTVHVKRDRSQCTQNYLCLWQQVDM